ncbi:MAG TPA: BON domain-containing protein [Dyella sp.]|nr:BON domain-containing protein [Dyella sp.]
MRHSLIRKNLIALSLIAAFGAVSVAQASAQDASAKTEMKSDMHQMKRATSDAWITTKVKSEFATTKGVDATDISVTTDHGHVTLSGAVSGASEITAAREVAMKVEGVKSVDTSGLKVTGGDD